MHLQGYLLQHHDPHKRLCCASSYAGTHRRELLVVQASLNPFILSKSFLRPTRMKKISCLIAPLVFRRCLCGTYEMVYTEVPQSWDTSSSSKSMNHVSMIYTVIYTVIVWYNRVNMPIICILICLCTGSGMFVHRVRFNYASNGSSFSRLKLVTENKDARP